MNSHKMLISFIPWVAFTLVAGQAGAGFVAGRRHSPGC